MFNRLFNEAAKIQPLNVEDALAAAKYPASGSFIPVGKYERFAFLIALGASTSALTAKVQQATAANGTPKDITGATISIAADDDDQWAIIEVQTDHLDINNDYEYVTLDIAGAAGDDDFGAILFLGFNSEMPVTQTSQIGAVAVVG